MISDIDNAFQTGGEGSVINAPLFFQRAKKGTTAPIACAAPQVAILHFTYISILLIIILK